jgi:hypothetical protein
MVDIKLIKKKQRKEVIAKSKRGARGEVHGGSLLPQSIS